MLDRVRSSTVADVRRVCSWSEYHSTTFRTPKNSPQMCRSMRVVSSSIPTANYSTFPKQTFTCKDLIPTKRRIVLSSVIGSSIALRSFDVRWLFNLHFQSPVGDVESCAYIKVEGARQLLVGRVTNSNTYFIRRF